jgi:hypothetical protein
MLRCAPDFIAEQPKGHFAASIRNVTSKAVAIDIPFGVVEDLPRMTEEEFESVRNTLRKRYAVHWTDINSSHEKADEGERATASSSPLNRKEATKPSQDPGVAPSPDW